MWKIKTFKTLEGLNSWLSLNGNLVQWNEVFINNAYGVEYRPLRKVY